MSVRRAARSWLVVCSALGYAAAADFEGRVLEDSSANPLASAELRIHKAGAPELAADLDTDRQGRFIASGLSPGDYTIEVRKPNYLSTTFHLHIPSGPLSLRLVRYGVIDGHATDVQGRSLPGIVRAPTGRTIGSSRVAVLVKAPNSGELQSFREESLDEDGHYRIFNLPPGQYAVGFWYADLNEGSGMQLYPDNSHPRFFTVAGGEEFTGINFTVVPMPSASISGMLALPAGFKGQFQLSLGIPEHANLPIAQVLSEDNGAFRFEKIPSGVYDLFASGPVGGYGQFDSVIRRDAEPLFGRIRVQVAGQNVDGVDVPLSPARSFNLVLRAHGTEPYPAGCPHSVRVTLNPLEPWSIMFMATAEAAVGKEQPVKALPPGRFRLSAADLGAGCFQLTEPTVDLSAEVAAPVAVEVAAAGSVQGSLQLGSSPATDFAIVLMDSAGAGDAQTRIEFADAKGHFKFEALQPGRYRIAAQRGRWITDRTSGVEINIAGGAVTEVEIPVPPPESGAK